MEYALEIRDLSKKIGNKTILQDVSFYVMRGESVGMVGKNGAGKTSILKCISGLWINKTGTISVYGKETKRNFRECISRMGVLIEYPSLFLDMTLKQNIEYFGAFCFADYHNEVLRLLELLNLEQSLNVKIKTFSSGMKQKACLLIVLMKKPDILLLDEPTSMLDPKGAVEIRRFLDLIRKTDKISILISSHNLTELEGLCERVVVIEKGKSIDCIRTGGGSIKIYKLEFKDEASAKLISERSDAYETFLEGNTLSLKGNGETLKNYIMELKPDFIDLTAGGNLESAYLNDIGG